MCLNCIKIGIRKNLIYPLMFMIFINISRIIKLIFHEFINKEIIFLFPLLNFLSNIITSSIFLCHEHEHEQSPKSNENTDLIGGLQSYKIKKDIDSYDKPLKIYLLIIMDAYLDFIGCLRRMYFFLFFNFKKDLINIDIRIKNREIIFASLLCYFTIGTNLYKHQIFSLIIITIFLIIILLLELFTQSELKIYMPLAFPFFGMQTFINFCRVFSDTIEKYLFKFNFVNPYKIILIKGIIEILLSVIIFLFSKPRKEINYLLNLQSNELTICIILLILYFAFSGITQIYKIITIKVFSPMTRTLFDSFLDIFYFIYISINEDRDIKKINTPYFWINIISQIIIVFFNLVYNEFFVLYCCGMETNAYIEVSKRAKKIELANNNNVIFSIDGYIVNL